jgi:hypothetical protein
VHSSGGDHLRVSNTKPPNGDLKLGDNIVFEIDTPPYPAYLHVAYIDADGLVSNIVQPGTELLAAELPRTKIVLGEGADSGRYTVSPPFGREMLIVLAGKRPVFPEQRPKRETERQFLTALRQALIAKPYPSAPDPDVVAGYDAIITTER